MLFKAHTIISDKLSLVPGDLASALARSNYSVIFKNDLFITVGIMQGTTIGIPEDIVVKKISCRGKADLLLKIIFGSRAIRLFRISSRIYKKGLPIAAPLACIEPTFRTKHGFYISYAIENADNLADLSIKKGFSEPGKIARQLAETFAGWHLAGAVHGDMKWPNILMQKNDGGLKIFFVDLDQARLFDKPNIRGIIKDLSRFYRSGLEYGEGKWVETNFFPAYMDLVPKDVRTGIDLSLVKKSALKKWNKKKQPRYHS